MNSYRSIVFRADGNANSGLGHLYRLFAFFEICREKYACSLVTRFPQILEIAPTELRCLFIPEEIVQDEEPAWLAKKFDCLTTLIVLDGYNFRYDYQRKLKDLKFKLVYVDDLQAWDMVADLVINHSPSAELKHYQHNSKTIFALGTDYALVRKPFRLAASKPPHSLANGPVLVCFGGADPLNLTEKICESLLLANINRKIIAVVGAAKKQDQLEKFVNSHQQFLFRKNLNSSEMFELMEQAALAIVPTSTLLFELCCVKTPVISGYYVDNQIQAYHRFLELGLIAGIGNFETVTAKELVEKTQSLLNGNSSDMIAQQAKYFDGNQQQRLLNLLEKL